MSTTRGDLVPATIYKLNKAGSEVDKVVCMFNPFEYTTSKSNSYSEKDNNQEGVPHMEFKKSGAQTLKLELMFDTYESGEDVSQQTRKLWTFMMPTEPSDSEDKKEPPGVAFHWGSFYFVSVLTNMTQKFTLFKHDGTPVRAKVDVIFTQHEDVEDYGVRPPQNPTSGGDKVLRTWQIIKGDRLDTISASVYGDATLWRQIAEYNNLDHPSAVRPGQQIVIPQRDK